MKQQHKKEIHNNGGYITEEAMYSSELNLIHLSIRVGPSKKNNIMEGTELKK